MLPYQTKRMAREKALRGVAQYQTVVHRFEAEAVYRLRDQDRMRQAMETQDRIRERAKRGGDLTKVIREWRDQEAMDAPEDPA